MASRPKSRKILGIPVEFGGYDWKSKGAIIKLSVIAVLIGATIFFIVGQ
jgi:hypothetical protein